MLIEVGKETIITMRAVRAGLTKFWPMPPNICFTTTIATTAPKNTIHKGMLTGRLKANRIPVTTALRSVTVLSRFITLRQMYSSTTQESTETAITIKD